MSVSVSMHSWPSWIGGWPRPTRSWPRCTREIAGSGNQFTPSTCRPTGSTPARSARGRRRPRPPRRPRRLGDGLAEALELPREPCGRGLRAGPRQAGARADRGSADRLRGRLRDQARRAGGRRGDQRGRGPWRSWCKADRGAAVPRSADQVAGGAEPAAGVRTLDLFVGEFAGAEALTDGFVITLAKVTSVEQIEAMVGRARDDRACPLRCRRGR